MQRRRPLKPQVGTLFQRMQSFRSTFSDGTTNLIVVRADLPLQFCLRIRSIYHLLV